MKSPYIWIIIALLLLVIGLIVFWPSPEPDNTRIWKEQISRDKAIREELQGKLTETLARIKQDSLQQVSEAEAYKRDVDSLSARISQLRRSPRVITVLAENPDVKALVDQQDSLITVQAARIDTLTVNLADLRVNLHQVRSNFEGQITALESISSNQSEIIAVQEKELKRERRQKRLAIIGGIVTTIAALVLR